MAFLDAWKLSICSGEVQTQSAVRSEIDRLLARALVIAGSSATVVLHDVLKHGERRVVDGVEYVGIGPGQILLAFHKFVSGERPDWVLWEAPSHLWGPLLR